MKINRDENMITLIEWMFTISDAQQGQTRRVVSGPTAMITSKYMELVILVISYLNNVIN